jgi:hypothetical protein
MWVIALKFSISPKTTHSPGLPESKKKFLIPTFVPGPFPVSEVLRILIADVSRLFFNLGPQDTGSHFPPSFLVPISEFLLLKPSLPLTKS